jgi:hypothetical protein
LSPAGTASDNSLNNNINNKFAKNLFSLFWCTKLSSMLRITDGW